MSCVAVIFICIICIWLSVCVCVVLLVAIYWGVVRLVCVFFLYFSAGCARGYLYFVNSCFLFSSQTRWYNLCLLRFWLRVGGLVSIAEAFRVYCCSIYFLKLHFYLFLNKSSEHRAENIEYIQGNEIVF